MKKWQKVLIWLVVLALLGFGIMKGYVYYLKKKPHRDVTKEQGIGITADSLYRAYATDEQKANSLYTDKAIEVTGQVLAVSKDENNITSVELKTYDSSVTVNCKFKEDPGVIQPGNLITFKGKCTGFLLVSIPIIEGVLIRK